MSSIEALDDDELVRYFAGLSIEKRQRLVGAALVTLDEDQLDVVTEGVTARKKAFNRPDTDVARLDATHRWPELNTSRLLDHQKVAVAWILRREREPFCGVSGTLCSLEMGLGKTLIALTVVALTPGRGPTLYVCKTALLQTIVDEVAKFYGGRLNASVFHKDYLGPRGFSSFDFAQYNFIITTYDAMLALHKKKDRRLELVNWYRVIADESQVFRNDKTGLFAAISLIKSEKRLCLTGTPVVNTCADLETQLRWMGLTVELTPANYRNLDIERLLLEMKKSDVYAGTPVTRTIVPVNLSDAERFIYKQLCLQATELVSIWKKEHSGTRGDKSVTAQQLLVMITRMRQVCDAPYLITPESRSEFSLTAGESVVNPAQCAEWAQWEQWLRQPGVGTNSTHSSKMSAAVDLIRSIPAEDKILVFSNWVGPLKVLQRRLDHEMIKSRIGTGETKDLHDEIKLFSSDPECRVLLLSMGVGSVGLTITSANHCIMLEPHWNCNNESQAAARVDRIGQTKPVKIYSLITVNSVEKYMQDTSNAKLEDANEFLHGEKGVNLLDQITQFGI